MIHEAYNQNRNLQYTKYVPRNGGSFIPTRPGVPVCLHRDVYTDLDTLFLCQHPDNHKSSSGENIPLITMLEGRANIVEKRQIVRFLVGT